MANLLEAIHLLFPLLGGVFFFVGIKCKRKNNIIASLWICLIALILNYRASGGEILGSYFNYFHAGIYSLNLVVLTAAIIYLLLNSRQEFQSRYFHYSSTFLSATLISGGLLLLINLWVNAFFIGDRLPGTPILQVALFNKQAYCEYKYVFFKIASDNKIGFLCPNRYGLLPSVGKLDTAPSFVVRQLPLPLQMTFQQHLGGL